MGLGLDRLKQLCRLEGGGMRGIFDLDEFGRISGREGKTLEFKRDLSSPKKPLQTIVAFANSAGGRLVIGVRDDRSICGVPDPLEMRAQIGALIATSIAPHLAVGIDFVPIGSETVVVVDVPASATGPHYMVEKGPEEGVYVRLDSHSQPAGPALIADLKQQSEGISFEALAAKGAALDDLDPRQLAELDAQPASVEDLLRLGLVTAEGGDVTPTYAGILAACPDPSRFVPSAWIQCARLHEGAGPHATERVELRGPLPALANKTMDFLLSHAYQSTIVRSADGGGAYSIPVAALREVVVNALLHATYAQDRGPLRVTFHDERIEVESPGTLLPGVTVESMLGASRLRNPLLARVFEKAGLTGQWGTGMQSVLRQVAAEGLPTPTVEETGTVVRITVFVRSHSQAPGWKPHVVKRRVSDHE